MQSVDLPPKVDTLAYIVICLSWIDEGPEAMRILEEYQVHDILLVSTLTSIIRFEWGGKHLGLVMKMRKALPEV